MLKHTPTNKHTHAHTHIYTYCSHYNDTTYNNGTLQALISEL